MKKRTFRMKIAVGYLRGRAEARLFRCSWSVWLHLCPVAHDEICAKLEQLGDTVVLGVRVRQKRQSKIEMDKWRRAPKTYRSFVFAIHLLLCIGK